MTDIAASNLIFITMSTINQKIDKIANIIREAKHVTAFTGAGISVESGIPPFRGENGLWSKYDPDCLDLSLFHQNPLNSWTIIREIFYDFFGQAKPNAAHFFLADLEKNGLLKAVITQNIDNLHQEAGSKTVYEFHGNSRQLVCTQCGNRIPASKADLKNLPPTCSECGSVYKPDFIFFGEGIPPVAYQNSMKEAAIADIFIVIGTTGEVMPASMIPQEAKKKGAKIIEINPEPSLYTHYITDFFMQGKATHICKELEKRLV